MWTPRTHAIFLLPRLLAGVPARRFQSGLVIEMLFDVVVFVAAVLSGATASIAGFGIGSVLTPLVALHVATPVAVAAVALPHALATALRCWRLRAAIEWKVLRDFGLLSAAGGFAG